MADFIDQERDRYLDVSKASHVGVRNCMIEPGFDGGGDGALVVMRVVIRMDEVKGNPHKTYYLWLCQC